MIALIVVLSLLAIYLIGTAGVYLNHRADRAGSIKNFHDYGNHGYRLACAQDARVAQEKMRQAPLWPLVLAGRMRTGRQKRIARINRVLDYRG